MPPQRIKQSHIPELDRLAQAHFASTKSLALSLSGRYLPLAHKMISTLLSAPHNKSIFIMDIEARFDPTRLSCTFDDLQHVYVQTVRDRSPETIRLALQAAEKFMFYDDASRSSKDREWWGTFVFGGISGGDVTCGWSGWLNIEKYQPEAVAARDHSLWLASSEWGSFVFTESISKRNFVI